MAISTATAIIGASIVGAGASVAASNSAAKAINASTQASSDATGQSIQFAREAQGIAAQELGPWANTGAQANDAIAKMLGLPGASVARPAAQPGGASSTNPGAMPGSPDWAAYAASDPGIAREYMRSQSGKGAGQFASLQDYAKWHFENYGRAEGRVVPTVPQPAGAQPVEAATQQAPSAPAYSGAATNTNPAAAGYEASPWGTMVEDANRTFESSPFFTIANDEIDKAIGDLDAKYGASGLLLSGGATRARAEIAAQIRGDLFREHLGSRTANFGDYFGALTNTSNTGLTAASGISSGGANFANTASTAVQNNAANASSAAIAAAQAKQQGVSDAVGFGGWALGNLAGRTGTTLPTMAGARSLEQLAAAPATQAATLAPVVPTYRFGGP